MRELEKKRDELLLVLRKAHRELAVIQAAIRVLDETPGPVLLFRRGELMQLVCDAQRAGFDQPLEIAHWICREKAWDAAPELVRDVRLKVKAVTKLIRRREREDAVRLEGERD
jgi:hypothetical protein